jgi:hypothetical protein
MQRKNFELRFGMPDGVIASYSSVRHDAHYNKKGMMSLATGRRRFWGNSGA